MKFSEKMKNSIDAMVSQSIKAAPKEYEDLLRQLEKSIREYIEQLNYYELQIEKHE